MQPPPIWTLQFWFGRVDARPVAFFRLVLALLLFKEIIYFWPLVAELHSETGILPHTVYTAGGLGWYERFSLLDAFQHTWQVHLFLVAWGVIIFHLLIGYHSRLMALLNFICLASFQMRNTFIMSGADNVLSVLSFWAIFLPLGACYSVDNLQKRWRNYLVSRHVPDLRPRPGPPLAYAWPVRLLQLQIGLIYLMNTILKLPSPVWRNGHVLHYLFQFDAYVLPPGRWLLHTFPLPVLQLLDYWTLFIEGTFILLIFLPFWQPKAKVFALGNVALLHLGIAFTTVLGRFSLIMLGLQTVLWEAEWLHWLNRQGRDSGRPLQLSLPAGSSPLWVAVALVPAAHLTVTVQEQPAPTFDGWQLTTAEGKILTGWAAWQTLLRRFPTGRLWSWLFYPAGLRQWVWLVAQLFLPFVPAPSIHLPHQIPARVHPAWSRAPLTLFLAGIMFLVVWLNLRAITIDDQKFVPPVSGLARQLIFYTGLVQRWTMFSAPPQADQWLVPHGYFADGSELDLYWQEPPTDQPRLWFGRAVRWQKYQEQVIQRRNEVLWQPWADYYCRTFPTLHKVEFELWIQPSHRPGEELSQPRPSEKELLFTLVCPTK